MADTEVWTIGRLLAWTTDFLRKHGADSPRLDAEVLLAQVRNCQRIALYTAFEDVASDDERKTFRELVKKRADGAPVAQLVGYKEFYSLRLRVTGDVLIPRPETESLVVEALDFAKGRPETRVADVGVGSGAISVALAKHAANCRITAIDISPAALEVAADNARQHGVESRIDFRQGDLFASLPAEAKFDLVVSNPPYVTSAEMKTLPRDVRDFEPHLALEAGPTGTDVMAGLIPQAAERLEPGGLLLIEISPMIHPAVAELLTADARYEPAAFLKDPAGKLRVAKARRRD